jgi:ketosteroid isomerase-like protein
VIGCFGVVALAIVAFAQEPVKPALHPRIVTATRQATLFSGLEKQMLDAVQKKNAAALKTMLTEECTIHLPDADPMPGDEWVESVMSNDFNLKSYVVRQVDVAEVGNTAVVSYERVQESTFKGQNDGGEFFVVDLWKKDGEQWKLADRYVSKVGAPVPTPTSGAKGDVKPTGKK